MIKLNFIAHTLLKRVPYYYNVMQSTSIMDGIVLICIGSYDSSIVVPSCDQVWKSLRAKIVGQKEKLQPNWGNTLVRMKMIKIKGEEIKKAPIFFSSFRCRLWSCNTQLVKFVWKTGKH